VIELIGTLGRTTPLLSEVVADMMMHLLRMRGDEEVRAARGRVDETPPLRKARKLRRNVFARIISGSTQVTNKLPVDIFRAYPAFLASPLQHGPRVVFLFVFTGLLPWLFIMSDASKPRSSSIDLGAAVVVKREGELQGQRGKRQLAGRILLSAVQRFGWL